MQTGISASNHTKKSYIAPHKRNKYIYSAAPGIFWGFLRKRAKTVEELRELMALCGVGSCVGSCAGSFGSCDNSGGKSIYGFMGTSPPAKVVDLKARNPQKQLTARIGSLLFLAFFAFAMIGCQRYYCEDGRKVKDEKDCYTATDDAIFEISSIDDLNSKTAQIQQTIADGKSVEVKFTGSPTTAQAQFGILETFGSIYREHTDKININYNGFAVNPATEGLLLTHETWRSWGCLKLGANGSIKWVVPSNEAALFNNQGQGNAVVGNAPPVTKRTIDVQTNAELVAAPQQVRDYLPIYTEEILLKVGKSFLLTRPGMNAMTELVTLEKQPNQFALHNGQARFSGLEDNTITIDYAATMHRMNQRNMLPNNVTLAGGKYYHLQTGAQATRDSLLGISGVIYTFPEAYTNAMPNLNKEIPRKLTCNRDVEDARTIFSSVANFLDTYKGEIQMVMSPRADKPWGEQNFVGFSNAFSKHCDVQNPRIPVQDGVSTKLKFQNAPVVGNYVEFFEEPQADGLNISPVNFGTDGSGELTLASFEKALFATGYPYPRITKINVPGRNIPLNIKANKSEYIDGTQIVVSLSFLKNVEMANQIRGPTIDGSKDYIFASNLKIYVDPELRNEFQTLLTIHDWNIEHVFLRGYGIEITNCTWTYGLPAGKQPFDWKANNAGTKANEYQKKKATNFAPLLGRDNQRKN